MKNIWIFAGGTAVLVVVIAIVNAIAPPTWTYAITGNLLVSELALAGVFALSVNPTTMANITKFLVALGAGAIAGNIVMHLMPESFEHVAAKEISAIAVSLWMSLGFLFCFVLDKGLKFRCHHAGACHHSAEQCLDCSCGKKDGMRDAQCKLNAGHEHEDHAPGHGHIDPTGHMVWTAHFMDNFNDGVLIGAGFLIDPAVGVATTLCILAHEVPVEFGGFGVMVKSGIKPYAAIALNLASAGFALLGTILVLWLGTVIKELPIYLTPVGTGFSLYLLCRLVPMIRDEPTIKRSLLTMSVFHTGFGAMVAAKFLEIWLGA